MKKIFLSRKQFEKQIKLKDENLLLNSGAKDHIILKNNFGIIERDLEGKAS